MAIKTLMSGTAPVDDGDEVRSGALPVYVRFPDLEAANIVGSWTQLARLLKDEGFPAGVMLSPNIRAWRLDQVTAWLAERPTAKKILPDTARRPREKALKARAEQRRKLKAEMARGDAA